MGVLRLSRAERSATKPHSGEQPARVRSVCHLSGT